MPDPTPLAPEDYYLENGLFVFTAAYHLKRGYCCGNACRHCPFNHENVPANQSPNQNPDQNPDQRPPDPDTAA